MDRHEQIGSNLPASETTSWVVPLAQGRSLTVGPKTLIMGILNVTPDSFSDGGRFFDTDKAVAHALEMAEAGADIIDIGGASSRPDSAMATEAEEMHRILPVIKRLVSNNLILSVDTFRGAVADAVLDQGVHIINDIGNFDMDPGMLEVLVKWKAAAVLMHNRLQIRQEEKYQDIVAEITADLGQAADTAINAGLSRESIIIDPGLGFGKTPTENLLLIKRLDEFHRLGYPVLLGASRKRFIGHTLRLDSGERLEGSLAVAVIGIMNGANIVRAHDVKETKRAAAMADAVRLSHG